MCITLEDFLRLFDAFFCLLAPIFIIFDECYSRVQDQKRIIMIRFFFGFSDFTLSSSLYVAPATQFRKRVYWRLIARCWGRRTNEPQLFPMEDIPSFYNIRCYNSCTFFRWSAKYIRSGYMRNIVSTTSIIGIPI